MQEDAQELYSCCCSHDPQVCEAAFKRLGDFVARVARKQLQGQPNLEQTAKDCSQQALFTIWQKLSAGKGPDHIEGFLSWCAAIVIHKVLDELRKTGRSRTLSLDEQTENDDDWLTQLADANTPTPETHTVETEVKVKLIQLIQNHGQLSPEAKFVLLYGYLLEWNDDELAKYLDKKRVSIRVLRFRGLQTLRDDLEFMHSLADLMPFEVSSEDESAEE
jgi:RNA polymerase sigma factor (sigma-70 family)